MSCAITKSSSQTNMKTIFRFIYFLPVLSCSLGAFGQQLNAPAAMHQNFSLLNPAFLGSAPSSSILLSYRKQWSGLPNAPELLTGIADLRFKSGRSGIGVEGSSYNVGMIQRTALGLGYAYRLKFNEQNHLGFGISAGIEKTNIDFSRIIAQDPDEISTLQQLQGTTIGRFSIGAMYQLKQWQVGLNVQFYTGNRVSFTNPVTQSSVNVNKVPNYSFVTRLPITLSERWLYTPSVVLFSTQGLPISVDNLHQFTFDGNLQFGAGYRQLTNAYLQLGYTFYSQVSVQYVYQRNFSSVGNLMANTHELSLRFMLGKGVETAVPGGNGKVRQSEVLQEQIDNNEARLRPLQSRLDSLEGTMNIQRKEIEDLKKEQVTMEELKQIVQAAPDDTASIRLTSYEVINVMNEDDIRRLIDEPNTSYYIVLGAFRNLDKAQELKKMLKRDLSMDLRLVSMESNGRIMYLVTQPKEYTGVKEATGDLLKFRKNRRADYESYLNGEPWVLKMKK